MPHKAQMSQRQLTKCNLVDSAFYNKDMKVNRGEEKRRTRDDRYLHIPYTKAATMAS